MSRRAAAADADASSSGASAESTRNDQPALRYTYRHRVRYRECDPMGVVYHTHYLDWFEAARTEGLREAGLAYSDLERGGVMMPVVEVSVRYFGAARYDQEVAVETTLHAPDGTRVVTEYEVRVDGSERPIVVGRVVLAFVDAERRRPIPAPEHVTSLLRRAAAGRGPA